MTEDNRWTTKIIANAQADRPPPGSQRPNLSQENRAVAAAIGARLAEQLVAAHRPPRLPPEEEHG